MPNPMIRIHNVETDETIDREMTSAELADFNAKKELDEQKQSEREAKIATRASALAKLATLGLSADEIAVL